ncbi:acetyl-CoA carboxylase biotin carboxyl carrier protein [Ilyobacter polytropus]|uniref:Biotin/lipoyl attachment domain-containing protein n=1 Tax=Ilyobacter polytropus (strain ATCC 51220 / DSM 2926 / LMG 16218 / CuHBu1) TaxID=572544 RepID=E3H820_ILYPC|nr:biotin/lipoyl-containing protein [Ilyobacter polytropus]ADO83251.1 biotin/lipoyl attachment domain-containing protein [Ilyobacter polytropus DSM 2926]
MKDDINNVEDLMQILNDTNLTEINFESEDLKIVLKRPKLVPVAPQQVEVSETENEVKETKQYKEVKSYNVGKFSYRNKSGKAIIKVGDKIKEGQEIGSISTIGVNSPVTTPYAGTVKEILLEEGSLADYGKNLVLVELD